MFGEMELGREFFEGLVAIDEAIVAERRRSGAGTAAGRCTAGTTRASHDSAWSRRRGWTSIGGSASAADAKVAGVGRCRPP